MPFKADVECASIAYCQTANKNGCRHVEALSSRIAFLSCAELFSSLAIPLFRCAYPRARGLFSFAECIDVMSIGSFFLCVQCLRFVGIPIRHDKAVVCFARIAR